MVDFFQKLLDSSDWPPRWHCGEWTQFHGWLYIISDLLIWAAYFSIPVIILKYILRKNNTRFFKLYILFAAFILACGGTHFLDAVAFWIPMYRLSAVMRFLTAVISWITVFYLFKYLSLAFSLKSPEELLKEVDQHKVLEEEIHSLNTRLKQNLEEQTASFRHTQKEISDYKYALDESSIVAITNQKGIITYVNKNFCAISKYNEEELIGQDHRIINSGYHSKEFIKELWITIANGKIWKGELRNKAKDGTIYWVDTTIIPFLNEQKKPYQYVAIRADITERKRAEENLRKSLKETSDYKYALEESSIVAITDQKGIIKYANKNFCAISKYTEAELIGQDHRIINSGYHSKEYIKNLWVTIANGKIWKGELKNKAKDGTIYWVDTTIVPFLNEENKPYQYVAIRSDITARKVAEANIQEAEERYRTSLDSMIEGFQIIDYDFKYVYINPSAASQGRTTPDKLIGKSMMEVYPGIENSPMFALLKQTMEKRTIEQIENEFGFPDGTSNWFELRMQPSPEGALILSKDITAEKIAERKIAESERTYRAIASNIPGTVICLFDSDFRYTLIEGDMLEKAGYSKNQLLNQKANDVIPPDRFDYIKKAYEKVFKGEANSFESNRSGYDFITRFVPLKNEEGKVYMGMSISIDVTELKKAERHIAELNIGLEEKIERRTAQLEAANKELESFSYSVSHDLRAPLRAVHGYAKMLEEDYHDVLDGNGKRLLNIVQSNASKMGALIDDLLTFSRLGRKEIQKSVVDIHAIVSDIINDLPKSNATITLHQLHPALADASLIKQVLVNLILNAVKYSSKTESPLIDIRSTEEANSVTYTIKDNGSGFDMAYADKLFGVFQRLHTEEEFEGTGTGLAIVKKIVDKHKGKVWAEGKVNQGATFYFSLPTTKQTIV